MVSCSIISMVQERELYAANHARRPPSASAELLLALLGRCFIEKRANRLLGLAKASSCGLTRVCVTRAIPVCLCHGERVRYAALSGTCANCTLCITHGVIKWNRRNFVLASSERRRIKPTCGPLPWVTPGPIRLQPYQRYAARFPSLNILIGNTIALLVLNERIAANATTASGLTMMVLLCDDLRQSRTAATKQAIGAVVIPAPICRPPLVCGRYPY